MRWPCVTLVLFVLLPLAAADDSLLTQCEARCAAPRACLTVNSGTASETCASARGLRCRVVESVGTSTALCLAPVEEQQFAQGVRDLSAALRVEAVSVVGRDARRADRPIVVDYDTFCLWRHAEIVAVVDADLSGIEDLPALPRLSSLSIRNSTVRAFPYQVLASQRLKSLDLRGNPITNASFSEIEAQYIETQLDFFAIDPIELPATCDEQRLLRGEYTVCVHQLSASAAAGTVEVADYSEIDSFFASTGSAANSTSSPSTTTSNGVAWIILGAVIGACWFIAILAYCVYRRKKLQDDGACGSNADFVRSQQTLDLHDDDELHKWMIDPEALVPIRQIGSGAFATVWLAQYLSDTVVIKRLKRKPKDKSDISRDLVSELLLLANLDHPKIVTFIGVAWCPQSDVELVVEYMSRGDLRAHLTATKGDLMAMSWTRRKLAIAADIAEALAYLHSREPAVLHRDVTSNNILLDENFTAKLADFGLSRLLSQSTDGQTDLAMTKAIGTSRWIAPEVLQGEGRYDTAADMYSFGVVLCELDAHEPPFFDVSLSSGQPLSDTTVLELLRAGAIQPTLTPQCPKPVSTLLLECLSTEPQLRPSAKYAASRLHGMIERLKRLSDVGDDVLSDSELGIDSFLGSNFCSRNDSDRSDLLMSGSQYSLLGDSN